MEERRVWEGPLLWVVVAGEGDTNMDDGRGLLRGPRRRVLVVVAVGVVVGVSAASVGLYSVCAWSREVEGMNIDDGRGGRCTASRGLRFCVVAGLVGESDGRNMETGRRRARFATARKPEVKKSE